MEKITRFKYFMDLKSKITKKALNKLLLLVLIFNSLDGILTFVAFKYFDVVEQNPIMNYIIFKVGLDNAMIFKIISVFILILFIINYSQRLNKTEIIITFLPFLFVLLMVFVVVLLNTIRLTLFIYP